MMATGTLVMEGLTMMDVGCRLLKNMCKEFGLTNQSSVLQIGCDKGFLLHDFQQAQPGIKILGTDISEYAIEHAFEIISRTMHCN